MTTVPAASPNADARSQQRIDHLILHYTGMQTASAALQRLRNPAAKVSSHYLVDEDGTIYTLVKERLRAWHAGVSFWRGVKQLNDRSVGIEIVNPGHEFGYRAFPAVQMLAVLNLCREIVARHGIPARNMVGHSDVAPDRKQDPGELFPWAWLAGHGLGVWTEAAGRPADLRDDLAAIGYDMALPGVITAFQRHFLPGHLSGVADEVTARRAAAVREMVDQP